MCVCADFMCRYYKHSLFDVLEKIKSWEGAGEAGDRDKAGEGNQAGEGDHDETGQRNDRERVENDNLEVIDKNEEPHTQNGEGNPER